MNDLLALLRKMAEEKGMGLEDLLDRSGVAFDEMIAFLRELQSAKAVAEALHCDPFLILGM